MRGLRLAGPRQRPQRDVVAARPLRRAARIGHRDVHVGRRSAGPAAGRGRRGGGARSLPDRRPVQHAHAADADGGGRRRHLRVRSRGDPLRAEPHLHRRHLHRVRRRHRLRRAIEDAVPRDQPQLAGERSLPRRHHDGVRRADAGDSDRRRRQVRRRDARRVPAAAHRGPLHRLGNARVGRELGRRSTATSSSRTPTPTSAAR